MGQKLSPFAASFLPQPNAAPAAAPMSAGARAFLQAEDPNPSDDVPTAARPYCSLSHPPIATMIDMRLGENGGGEGSDSVGLGLGSGLGLWLDWLDRPMSPFSSFSMYPLGWVRLPVTAVPLPPGSSRKVLAPVLRGPRDRRQCTYGAAAVVSYVEPPDEEPPATDEACSAGARAPCPVSKSRSPESIRIYNPIYIVDLKYI